MLFSLSYQKCKNNLKFNFSGWSFGLGVVGAVMSLIASSLFLTEATVQDKKRRQLQESQSKFEIQHETKA